MGQLARMVLGLRKPQPQSKAARVTEKRAHEIRQVNDTEYFQSVIARLERQAQMPVIISDIGAQMAEQVGRQNAYRELLIEFRKDLETAERQIAEDFQRQRNR